MGNYCSTCGVNVNSGNYCQSCRERKFPSCDHCGRPLLSNQEIVGNYHRFPCYSQSSGQCSNCDAPVDPSLNGSYCRNCYDSKYPPPRRLHARDGDRVIDLYMRDDDFNSRLEPLAYAFGRGLSDGGKQRRFLSDH